MSTLSRTTCTRRRLLTLPLAMGAVGVACGRAIPPITSSSGELSTVGLRTGVADVSNLDRSKLFHIRPDFPGRVWNAIQLMLDGSRIIFQGSIAKVGPAYLVVDLQGEMLSHLPCLPDTAGLTSVFGEEGPLAVMSLCPEMCLSEDLSQAAFWSPADRRDQLRIHRFSDGSSRQVARLNGNSRTPLGPAKYWRPHFSWHPSGEILSFHDQGRILTVDLNTGSVEVVAQGFWPSWSPAGDRLAYASPKGDLIIETKTGGAKIKSFPKPVIHALAWSPDSRYLAVPLDHGSAWTLSGKGELAILDSVDLSHFYTAHDASKDSIQAGYGLTYFNY